MTLKSPAAGGKFSPHSGNSLAAGEILSAKQKFSPGAAGIIPQNNLPPQAGNSLRTAEILSPQAKFSLRSRNSLPAQPGLYPKIISRRRREKELSSSQIRFLRIQTSRQHTVDAISLIAQILHNLFR